ncbi:P-loop containing nucleoside triphosphate hydrolase protein [Ephemerocybe angulata]|uniref:DNA 3'-5' helicase n=1 Tax=Ephemerocybe angulata TaxID=980116 RepID=A0A8H6MEJ4_9AGAR|nr:P-loop containing nucleoside triphosphate hydrolase protein [Tulosesus angulatus]
MREPMMEFNDISKSEVLERVRKLTNTQTIQLFQDLVPQHPEDPELGTILDLAPTYGYLDTLNTEDRILGLKCCILIWIASDFRIIPRRYQLESTIATLAGRDSLIDVGTGYGKTICMILPALYDPQHISIIVSPLKRLQVLQVLTFLQYGLRTVAINEDTPGDVDLWTAIRSGHFPVLIVQPEQLASLHNGPPRLSRLLAEDRKFVERVGRIHIDEAHFIYTAGKEKYSMPAFREAWGRLGEARIKVGKRVPTQALSGTQPPHIKKVIISDLMMNEKKLCSIKLTSNRHNTSYITHPIIGDITDYRNLHLAIPRGYTGAVKLPKIVVFHDSREQAAAATQAMNEWLPEHLRNTGCVAHYHSMMSKSYLTRIFENFSNPDGNCRILNATEGASTGLDVEDVDMVIQNGVPRDVPTFLQRAGRAGRKRGSTATVALLYEPSVMNIDLSKVAVNTKMDPDYPHVGAITTRSKKLDRVGVAIASILQSSECLRLLFARYLGDSETPGALDCDPKLAFCCDRHGDVNLKTAFPGPMLYESPTGIKFYGPPDDPASTMADPPQGEKRSAVRNKYRRNQKELITLIKQWRFGLAATLGPGGSPSFVLSDRDIKLLARAHPTTVTSASAITSILDQTSEWNEDWAPALYTIIEEYDRNRKPAKPTTKKPAPKKAKVTVTPDPPQPSPPRHPLTPVQPRPPPRPRKRNGPLNTSADPDEQFIVRRSARLRQL